MLKNHLQQTIPHTLFELLSRYRISIPGIQRHYVQGANEPHATEVRKNFIRDILNHFRSQQELHLDFLFGPLDTQGADTFIPVDGQQRLTTLWLLARYAVERLKMTEDKASEYKEMLNLLSRFQYADRRYASRFCHALTDKISKEWAINDKKPSDALISRGLVIEGWRQDSTVQAMLNTLDTIDEQWQPNDSAEEFLDFLWEKVTFQLCMEHFPEDLYMKMNARGLQLTQWENAKGKFATYIKAKCVEKKDSELISRWNSEIENLSNNYFELMKHLPDNAFFAFLGRITHYLRTSPEGTTQLEALATYNFKSNSNTQNNLPYVPFEEFLLNNTDDNIENKDIDKSLILKPEDIDTLLKMMGYLLNPNNKDLQLPLWDDGEKDNLLNVVFLPSNLQQRTLSLVLFEYFRKFNNPSTTDFNHSLRLFWNVLNNVQPDTSNGNNWINNLKSVIEKATNPNLYLNENLHFDSDAVQYREEEAKSFIYRQAPEANGVNVQSLQKVESFMHGRVRMALLDLNNQNSVYIRPLRIQAFLDMKEAWKIIETRKKMIISTIMAMPYWPESEKDVDNNFILEESEDSLRTLLTKNEKYLQLSLLDCFDIKNSPEYYHDHNPYGWDKCPQYQQEQPWRRDWQANLLWLFENHIERIWGRPVQYHKNSDFFYLYQTSRLSWGSLPINDYRFDWYKSPSDQWKEFRKDYCKDKSISDDDPLVRITESPTMGIYNVREGINVYFNGWNTEIKAWNNNKEVYNQSVDYCNSEEDFFTHIREKIKEACDKNQNDKK